MRYLPPTPHERHRDAEQVRRQARDLCRAFKAGHPDAVALVDAHYRNADPATFQLSDALLVIARFHGFESWPRLKEELDRATVARLVEAVQAGDRSRVRALLRRRPELVHMDLAGDNEHRALHFAVLGRCVEMVRLLMEAGADPHQGIYPHRDATSAYTLARERGYTEVVAAIDEGERRRREALAGARSVAVPDLTPFVEALRGEAAESAIALLNEDPSLLVAVNEEGATALHLAAAALSEQVVFWLLNHGAEVDALDFRGHTPLDHAVRAVHWRRPGSLRRFEPVANRMRTAGARITPLAAVALGEREALISLHAERPEAFTQIDVFRGGLLSVAVQHDRSDVLESLLDLGLDPNEATQVLELEEKQLSSGMPLWHCAGSGRLDLAELLLERGADPNAQVYASGSAVFQAYGQRDKRMIVLLRRYGGRVDAITAGLYRHTALGLSFLEGGNEVSPSLKETGEKGIRDLLWAAACGGDPAIVAACLERLDWPKDDTRWFEILEQPLRLWNHGPGHWVPRGAEELDRSTYALCFRLILERCDPNLVGRFGATMLHRVAALGSTWGQPVMTEAVRSEFATMLLDAGAQWDVRDDLLRSTPLGWAARWNRLGMARLLVERGAPIDELDAEPWAAPLAWAEKSGHTELAAWLQSVREVPGAENSGKDGSGLRNV